MAQATGRRTPYKDFLQPALHRRFSTTASIILAIAFAEAFILAPWNSWFWTWFPIGPAGFRTFSIFLSGLFVLILRIAQYHVGLRTSNSPLQTFLRHAPRLQTLEALVSYTLSAWLFSQVYLWSVPEGAGLTWINNYGGGHSRLNEKALFFTTHFVVFGFIAALSHMTYDVDHLRLGVARPRKDGASSTTTASGSNGDTGTQLKKFGDQLPAVFIDSVRYSLLGLAASVILYPFGRRFAWAVVLPIFRPFYSLPRYNILPLWLPFSMWLLLRCLMATFMLTSIWLAGNTAFSIFLVKEPIKNGKPLTSDSKDPNGSLLNGLKSKKFPVQCFATWELAFIARDYEDRRKSIFDDIDRKDGSMWSQTQTICLKIIKEIEDRIDNFGRAPAPPPVAAAPGGSEPPKREVPPLKTDQVLISPSTQHSIREEVKSKISKVVTDPNQPSRLKPMGKAGEELAQRLLAVKQQVSGPENLSNPIQSRIRAFLASPLGKPFRQTFNKRLTAAVFGSPYGEPGLYINAVDALSQLAVRSLQEDKYGNVQRDVAGIIRNLTRVTGKLAEFRDAFPSHWTDVQKQRASPEVDEVLEALRDGLSDLVLHFGPYSRDLRLSLTDMRLAREAIGVPSTAAATAPQVASRPEMEQLR